MIKKKIQRCVYFLTIFCQWSKNFKNHFPFIMFYLFLEEFYQLFSNVRTGKLFFTWLCKTGEVILESTHKIKRRSCFLLLSIHAHFVPLLINTNTPQVQELSDTSYILLKRKMALKKAFQPSFIQVYKKMFTSIMYR